MNKITHVAVLTVFSIGCWFIWALLLFGTRAMHDWPLPAFTRFCFALRPVLIVLPVLAACYCLWVLLRKAECSPPWVRFFAATVSALVLVTLPVAIALYLPLVHAVVSRAPGR